MAASEREEFNEVIKDFSDPNGRFAYFAQLHGWYEQLNQARACFDMKSTENTSRLGAYDLRTAAYRFIRILGARPSYLLGDGMELTDGLTIDKLGHRPELIQELKRGSLSQWLSIFYHEDPEKDFSETYSYERSLESWILMLGRLILTIPISSVLVLPRKRLLQNIQRCGRDSSRRRVRRRPGVWCSTHYVVHGYCCSYSLESATVNICWSIPVCLSCCHLVE